MNMTPEQVELERKNERRVMGEQIAQAVKGDFLELLTAMRDLPPNQDTKFLIATTMNILGHMKQNGVPL